MFAALILVISLAMLAQWGLFYWRALVAGVAAEPLSDRMRSVAGDAPGSGDFRTLDCIQQMCPELGRGGRKIGTVRFYYRILALLRLTVGSIIPALSGWAGREMSLCSRYVAVVMDQRLRRNLACMAAIQSH